MSFEIKGDLLQNKKKPYLMRFPDLFVSFDVWIVNKSLEVDSADSNGNQLIRSEYFDEGFFRKKYFLFYDHNDRELFRVSKGNLFVGNEVNIGNSDNFKLRKKRELNLENLGILIESTPTSLKISSLIKDEPEVVHLGIGYFSWLLFKRWHEMD